MRIFFCIFVIHSYEEGKENYHHDRWLVILRQKHTGKKSWRRNSITSTSIVARCTGPLRFTFCVIISTGPVHREVKKALREITLEFIRNPKSRQSEIHLNEENVEYLIRDLVIAEKVSDIAAIREVRQFAVAQQQKMGKGKGIIMDGKRYWERSYFPRAELKNIYDSRQCYSRSTAILKNYSKKIPTSPSMRLKAISRCGIISTLTVKSVR